MTTMQIDLDPIEVARFDAKYVVTDSGCWEWTAYRHWNGYGQFKSSVSVLAHRFSWIRAHGQLVPAGLDIDHLCRNRACVNPDHLEAVTRAQNLRRGAGQGGRLAPPQTHCIHGHRFTAETVVLTSDGRRRCIPCRREHDKGRSHHRRAASA